jgi:hypothetical protein
LTKPNPDAVTTEAFGQAEISAVLRAIRAAERTGSHTPAMDSAREKFRRLRDVAARLDQLPVAYVALDEGE